MAQGENTREFSALACAGIERIYPKDSIIYLKGQPPEYLYYLVEGEVKSVSTSEDGDEVILNLCRSGAVFGEASFFDGKPRVSTAITLTQCRVRCINRAQIESAFAQSPSLAVNLLRCLSETVRLLSIHVDRVSFLSTRQRVISLLLARMDKSGRVTLSQESIAQTIGVTRMTVSRIVQELVRQDCLKTGYREICVTDAARLRAQLSE